MASSAHGGAVKKFSARSGHASHPRGGGGVLRKAGAKAKKKKPVSLKNQIRGLERLLKKVCLLWLV
jgi:hypothetical protein